MLDLQRSINRVSRSRHWKRTGGHVAVIGLLALAAATGIVSGTGRGISQQGAAANGSQPSLSFGLVALARAAESSTNPLAPLVVHLDPAAYQPTLSRDGSGGRIDPTLGNVSPLTLDEPLPAPPAPEPAREQGPVTDEPAPQSVAVAAGSDAASPGEPAAPAAPDGAPQRPLSWPVPGGAISQYFYAGHQGLDIAAPWNAPVLASADGVVTYAGWKNNGGGLVVEIAHETGLITSYNHLGGIWVNPGQEVARGEGIGAIGCTGLCYGSHLHFAVFVGLYADNPLRYF